MCCLVPVPLTHPARLCLGSQPPRDSARLCQQLPVHSSSSVSDSRNFCHFFAFVLLGRLKNYNKMSESEFKITEKQYNDANQTFNLFDKKGNGTVATKDLGAVFKSLGLQVLDEKLKEWADEADEDAAGFITWEQFKPVFEVKLKEDEDERELREAFRVLDKGNKGVIPVEDLRWLLQSLGDDLTEDEIEDMINETDTDGSGTVDYEEFRTLMNSN